MNKNRKLVNIKIFLDMEGKRISGNKSKEPVTLRRVRKQIDVIETGKSMSMKEELMKLPDGADFKEYATTMDK